MASKNPGRLYEQAVIFHQRGRLAQAVEHYRAFLRLVPDAAEVHGNMGAALGAMGQHAEAVRSFQRAVKLKPNFAQAHLNLGNALKEIGQTEEALRSLHRAVELAPGHVTACYLLGSTYREQGQYDQAKHWLQQGLRLQADNPHILNALGLVMRDENKPDQALELFKQATQIAPDYAEAWMNLGLEYHYDKILHEASKAFNTAVMLQPENTHAIFFLAKCLNEAGRFDHAIELLERLLTFSPQMPAQQRLLAHLEFSRALTGLHRVGEALQRAQRALEIDDSDEDAQINLMLILQMKGEHARAEQLGLEFLGKKPGRPRLCQQLASSKKFSAEDQALVRLLQQQLENAGLDFEQKRTAHFALGKIHDDIRQYASAFRHYAEAHRLRRLQNPYDVNKESHFINRLIKVFEQNYFALTKGLGVVSELPVFVVGMPRSGSTLIEQIIAGHPQAAGAGEVVFFPNAQIAMPLELATELPYPECAGLLGRETCQAVAERYLQKLQGLASRKQALRIVDKMPHNFMQLGLIASILPKAKIIHIKREAMDNCLSIYSQNFDMHEYADDLRDLGKHYLGYERLMRHWKKVLPLPVLDVSYEALVQNQEAVSRQIIEFIGLPWHNDCLQPHKTGNIVRTASTWQVRQPVYQTSVARWKNYEPWLGPLKETLGID